MVIPITTKDGPPEVSASLPSLLSVFRDKAVIADYGKRFTYVKCKLLVWWTLPVTGEDRTPKGFFASFFAVGFGQWQGCGGAVEDYGKRFMYMQCGLFVWRVPLPANTELRRISLLLSFLSASRGEWATADYGNRFMYVKCALFVWRITLVTSKYGTPNGFFDSLFAVGIPPELGRGGLREALYVCEVRTVCLELDVAGGDGTPKGFFGSFFAVGVNPEPGRGGIREALHVCAMQSVCLKSRRYRRERNPEGFLWFGLCCWGRRRIPLWRICGGLWEALHVCEVRNVCLKLRRYRRRRNTEGFLWFFLCCRERNVVGPWRSRGGWREAPWRFIFGAGSYVNSSDDIEDSFFISFSLEPGLARTASAADL